MLLAFFGSVNSTLAFFFSFPGFFFAIRFLPFVTRTEALRSVAGRVILRVTLRLERRRVALIRVSFWNISLSSEHVGAATGAVVGAVVGAMSGVGAGAGGAARGSVWGGGGEG